MPGRLQPAEKGHSMDARTYSEISAFYDHLMRSIDYNGWADYILDIIEDYKIEKHSLLELAGGNGKIARKIAPRFQNYFLTDLSAQMLRSEDNSGLHLICCDMTALPFRSDFDVIISTFDSVNYLMSMDKIKRMLKEAALCLKPGGIFTFDVSLEQNSIKYQKYLNRKGKFDGLKYVQKSFYDEKTRIHHNYFEITKHDGSVIHEKHRQKIYRFSDYFRAIDSGDLYVDNCFDAFTFKDADENSERAQFILKKRNR